MCESVGGSMLYGWHMLLVRWRGVLGVHALFSCSATPCQREMWFHCKDSTVLTHRTESCQLEEACEVFWIVYVGVEGGAYPCAAPLDMWKSRWPDGIS